jgi:hypothetical protein
MIVSKKEQITVAAVRCSVLNEEPHLRPARRIGRTAKWTDVNESSNKGG